MHTYLKLLENIFRATQQISWALFWVVFACLILPGQSYAGGRVALVYGNGAYQNAPKLLNPANDAKLVTQSLEAVGFEVVSVTDGSQTQMRKSLARFGRLSENADVAIFYYAGHGLQVAGKNWLLPIDADIESSTDLPASAINASTVLELMELSGAKARIAILDACRNNPLSRSLSRATSRGLAKIDSSAAGTMIIFATQPGNVALDGQGDNSPFSKALANHIVKPGIEIRQMMGRVRRDVMSETNDKQVPWVNEAIVGDLYLASAPQTSTDKPANSPPSSAAKPNNSALEIAFWESVKSSQDAAMMQLYIDRFPKGVFVDIAKIQVAKLNVKPNPKRVPNKPAIKKSAPKKPEVQTTRLQKPTRDLNQEMRKTALNLVANLQQLSSAQGTDFISSLNQYYATSVNFHGKPFTLSQIEKDKQRFAKRWPQRSYTLDHSSTEIQCYPDARICGVDAVIDWRVSSSGRNANASGRSATYYEVEFQNNLPQIVVESSEIISRN